MELCSICLFVSHLFRLKTKCPQGFFCCLMWQDLFLFPGSIIFHCVHVLHFLYVSFHEHLGCHHLSQAFGNNATMYIGVQISLVDPPLNFLGYILKSEMTASQRIVILLVFWEISTLFFIPFILIYFSSNYA